MLRKKTKESQAESSDLNIRSPIELPVVTGQYLVSDSVITYSFLVRKNWFRNLKSLYTSHANLGGSYMSNLGIREAEILAEDASWKERPVVQNKRCLCRDIEQSLFPYPVSLTGIGQKFSVRRKDSCLFEKQTYNLFWKKRKVLPTILRMLSMLQIQATD